MKQEQFSQRVQSYLQSPQSDKVLTLEFENHRSVQGISHSFFIFVLTDLLKGRSAPFLLPLNFREIENFLRDSNTTPAFLVSAEELSELESIFLEVKWQLLAKFFLKETHSQGPVTSWRDQSLAQKNAMSANWMEEIKKFLGSDLTPVFVFTDGETLTLKTPDGKWSDEALQNFFGSIWKDLTKAELIKVVAVS